MVFPRLILEKWTGKRTTVQKNGMYIVDCIVMNGYSFTGSEQIHYNV